MELIIDANLNTLSKSQLLLKKLTNDQLSNTSIGPYYSSIGSHLRHIFDFYNCIFNKNGIGVIDFTLRERNLDVENCCTTACECLEAIIYNLKESIFASDKNVTVIDDLGLGKVEINYTYEALLTQANSHTIHHYAIINYIIDQLGIKLDDESFGYNPSTPKK